MADRVPLEVCHRCGGTGLERDWRKFGATMRSLRLRHGLTLRQVARKMALSAAYLSDLELGRRPWQGDGARRVIQYLEKR